MSRSRITLFPEDLRLIEDLGTVLGPSSKIDVIHRSLILLKNNLDRAKSAAPPANARKRQSPNRSMTPSTRDVPNGKGRVRMVVTRR